jgi:tRNA-specific 2-thiouridylase
VVPPKKVMVGLSGGVDSSVAAALLLEQGFLVEAIFMRNWDSATNNDILGNPTIDDDMCSQEKDYQDALAVANQLGIVLHKVDFVKEYWDHVFTYFLNEYKAYRTPNPDVLCNKEIKFKAFLQHSETLGCDYIAMGHYARVKHNDHHILLRGLDGNKDQSYFLHQLTEHQLSKVLFPVGELDKKTVREIANKYDLATANKKDSTGVCFIGERDFKHFLQNYLYANPGDIVNVSGDVVGQHDGIMYYTIGQRKGLGIGGPGEAWFVVGKIPEKNQLIVGQGSDQELLFANRCTVDHLNFISEQPIDGFRCTAKFRYRQKDIDVIIKWIDKDSIMVYCDEPVKAITPGQSCVFYDGEVCLGGGVINQVYMNDVKRKY